MKKDEKSTYSFNIWSLEDKTAMQRHVLELRRQLLYIYFFIYSSG